MLRQDEIKHREDDLHLKWLRPDHKEKMIQYYEYANNMSHSPDKYYVQYHVFDLIVLHSDKPEAWKAVVDYFQSNREGIFDSQYSKHLSYRLQNMRECAGSFQTKIQVIVAYPRSRQKKKESSDQFLHDSGIQERLKDWKILTCKAYCYLSQEDYIKLLELTQMAAL